VGKLDKMKTDHATLKRMETLAKFVSGKKILDVGCRESNLKRFLPQGIEYYGLEKGDNNSSLQDKQIKILKEGILDSKVNQIFGKLKFDSIILAETLEHLPNPLKALENIYFLLKDGGQLVGSVPNAVGWRYFFFLELIGDGMADFSCPLWDGSEHLFTFNKYILRSLLMRAGFKVNMVREWGNWIPHTQFFLPFGLRGGHLLFKAEKS